MRLRRLVTAAVLMSLLVLVVLSGAACLYFWPPTVFDPPSGTVTTDRPFSSIDSWWLGTYPGGMLDAPTMYVLRSHDELVALQNSVTGSSQVGRGEVPEIYFEKELVIALIDVAEPIPGYGILINRLEETPDGIIVRATKTIYSHVWLGYLAYADNPRHVITTARTDKPFALSLRVVVQF